MPRLRNATACLKAVERAIHWLQRRAGDGPAWGCDALPLSVWHKLPLLLANSGRLEGCRGVLSHARDALLRPDGVLRSRPVEGGEEPPAAATEDQAWLALGAHHCGRFGISYPVCRCLMRLQGVNTGGVYDPSSEGKPGAADIRTTAAVGLLFLQMGRAVEARRAGRFVTEAVVSQIEEKRFFLRLDTQGRPIRKFEKGDTGRHVLSTAQGRATLSHLGVPIVFLTRLHLATGEQEWVEAAMDTFIVAENQGRECWTGPDAGALVWGAAALYDLTRRRHYYDAAEAIAQSQINDLGEDGAWRNGSRPDPETIVHDTIEAAACLTAAVREAQ